MSERDRQRCRQTRRSISKRSASGIRLFDCYIEKNNSAKTALVCDAYTRSPFSLTAAEAVTATTTLNLQWFFRDGAELFRDKCESERNTVNSLSECTRSSGSRSRAGFLNRSKNSFSRNFCKEKTIKFSFTFLKRSLNEARVN